MIAHAAIDITNQIFASASNTPVPLIIAFVVVLAAEAAYAFVLVSRNKRNVDKEAYEGGILGI